MMDLDAARQDPVDIDDARAKFVLWSRKEFYAKADLEADEFWYPPSPAQFHSLIRESEADREARWSREAAAHRQWQAERDRAFAEHAEKIKPLKWLLAEAQFYRVTFTGWITAFEVGGSAARIESIRAALETVLREAW